MTQKGGQIAQLVTDMWSPLASAHVLPPHPKPASETTWQAQVRQPDADVWKHWRRKIKNRWYRNIGDVGKGVDFGK